MLRDFNRLGGLLLYIIWRWTRQGLSGHACSIFCFYSDIHNCERCIVYGVYE